MRREVGIHAKTLNKLLQTKPKKVNHVSIGDRDVVDSQPATSSPLALESITSKTAKAPLVWGSEYEREKANQMQQIPSSPCPSPCEVAADVEERNSTNYSTLLKESLGHTEVEVIAGALLGFLVSLAVHALL